jgi:hypothetical protein
MLSENVKEIISGVEINCDMGEGYSRYKCGDDEGIMPYIDLANVACGFHASDPSVMHSTVALAKKHDVKVGAHPSFPDRQGFGRRVMAMEPEEVSLTIPSSRQTARSAFLPTAWRVQSTAPTSQCVPIASASTQTHPARSSWPGQSAKR